MNAEGLDLPPADWTWENFVNDYGPQVTKTNEDGTFEQVAMYLQQLTLAPFMFHSWKAGAVNGMTP